MTNSESRRYEMLVRVSEFGEAYRDRFPAGSLGRESFDSVARAITDLGEQSASTVRVAGGGKGAKTSARKALVEQLDAINRCVQVIAEDTPGFRDPFQLPQHRSAQKLLAAGRAFVREAAPARSRFTALGMPEDFVETLSRAVDGFEQALRSVEAGRDGHTAARAGIEAAFASGLAAVRKLDVIVPNLLRNDPKAMAVWERDRQVRYFSRTRKGVTAAQPTVPDPALKLAS
jgi:hypothetical protein